MEDDLASALVLDEDETVDDRDGTDFVDDGIEASIDLSSREWLPAATFDALVITDELSQHGGPGRMEIHTFAYLACLMSVFQGAPASDWSYSFTAVPPTLPYSPTVDEAITALLAAGNLIHRVESSDDVSLSYSLTEKGKSDLELLTTLGSLSPRLPFLQAAAKTAVFTSLHAVVNSLSYEPQIAYALSLERPRLLLSLVGAGRLYEEFDALTRVLGPEHKELIVPASLYVSFLQARARELNASLSTETDDDDPAE